jgi:hypothetical protein
MNKLKSTLLLILAILLTFSSYTNYRLAGSAPAQIERRTAPVVFVATAYEQVVARSDPHTNERDLKHGLRLNLSLTMFLLFMILTSLKERSK